jgi:hypothetical protein
LARVVLEANGMKSPFAYAALVSLGVPLLACSSPDDVAQLPGETGGTGGKASEPSGNAGSGGSGNELGGQGGKAPEEPCFGFCQPQGGSGGTGGRVATDGGGPGEGGMGGAHGPSDEFLSGLSEACSLSGRGVRTSSGVPSARVLGGSPAPVTRMRIADDSVYFAGGDKYLRRVPLAGGDVEVATIMFQRAKHLDVPAVFEVIGDHIYYGAYNPTLVRVLSEGGGVEAPSGEQRQREGSAYQLWATGNHLLVSDGNGLFAMPRDPWGPSETVTDHIAAYWNNSATDTFDGRYLTRLGPINKGTELRILDLSTGENSVVMTKKFQFVTETWADLGADCESVYGQRCETGAQYCTIQRISRETGAMEPFTAFARVDAPDYALAGDGALFFSYENELFRVAGLNDEPELVWRSDTSGDRVQSIHFEGSTLYVAAGSTTSSTIWEVEL